MPERFLAKTQELLTSDQMSAFQVRSEPQPMQEMYGDTNFAAAADGATAGGSGCAFVEWILAAGTCIRDASRGSIRSCPSRSGV